MSSVESQEPTGFGQARRRRIRSDGARTRQAILDVAVDVASLEGLESLTIGRLADKVKMSKSGLFAHFGSKEELQLATVEAARQRYYREVVEPIRTVPDGLPRLQAMCNGTLDYLRRRVFPGGCFFAVVRAEFSARPGPVRDKINRNKLWGRRFVVDRIRAAQANGELSAAEKPEQLAFELEALWDAPNWSLHTEPGERDIGRARRALDRRLEAAKAGP